MNSDKIYEIQAPYLVMDEAKELLNSFYVSKGPVKEVKHEDPKRLKDDDVFNEVLK